ncbi:hypothetical protein HHI36_018439 [Cryptolaemus montrouzieri]|uniref:Uncharacterized protein n=1 Tax=Cryptolaemus montrouzieri TaxID=559131 RepID=A0ABD2NZZ7_9CUCU
MCMYTSFKDVLVIGYDDLRLDALPFEEIDIKEEIDEDEEEIFIKIVSDFDSDLDYNTDMNIDINDYIMKQEEWDNVKPKELKSNKKIFNQNFVIYAGKKLHE